LLGKIKESHHNGAVNGNCFQELSELRIEMVGKSRENVSLENMDRENPDQIGNQ